MMLPLDKFGCWVLVNDAGEVYTAPMLENGSAELDEFGLVNWVLLTDPAPGFLEALNLAMYMAESAMLG